MKITKDRVKKLNFQYRVCARHCAGGTGDAKSLPTGVKNTVSIKMLLTHMHCGVWEQRKNPRGKTGKAWALLSRMYPVLVFWF